MAACKQTAFELIQDVFAPCIAVLCSEDVEKICAKSNLTFVQMVQPFCRLNAEVSIRDHNNIPSSIKNFKFIMKHLHSQPTSPTMGKKMMHDAVASHIPAADVILMNALSTDNYQLTYSSATPWYESYRDVFFQVTSSPEHEFFHNYLSCVFVVSSSHQDPLSQINDLSQQLIQYQNTHSSKWFFSQVFIYYVLIHDVSSEDLSKAEAVYQSMKSSFGSTQCHLLQINSVSEANTVKEANNSAMPDPWSQFLPKYYIQNNIINSHIAEENHVEFVSEEEKSGTEVQETNDSNSISHPLLLNSDSGSQLGNSREDLSTSLFSNKLNKYGKQRHGACLTQSDMDRIKCFVQDFCMQGLIPFIEKRIRLLNEQVANRKGIHRTLFGVTKKFFGNKPGVQGPASSLNSVVYGSDAPELQGRKLGDLCFMFQLYEDAYQAYHNAKRDFNADQAWLHFAGASEMAALSVFVQNNATQEYPMRYIESAITTYLQTCKLPDLATRATFLSTECLKLKGMYNEAATQFVRMPSDADLPSALCLEQAAHCYINCKPPKIRKFAFHIILAGHRFSKAGQRRHALRSYNQAKQVYQLIGWNFANNHINFTIGRLSVQLDKLESACSAFQPLLVSKCQLPGFEQANYLREYLFVLKSFLSQKTTTELPVLPVPLIKSEDTKVLLSEDTAVNNENGSLLVNGRGFDRGDLNNNVWGKLEEIVVNRISNNSVASKQLQCFTSKTNNITKPSPIAGEIISIEVALRNPLSVALTIDEVYPLWIFLPKHEENDDFMFIKNEPGSNHVGKAAEFIETRVLHRVIIEPHQEKKIHLFLIPKLTGELTITGIAYKLLSPKSQDLESSDEKATPDSSPSLSLQGKQLFDIKGPRLNRSIKERSSKVYADDNRLSFNVVSSMPKLQVKFNSFPYTLFCGEVQKVVAELRNVGKHRLKKIVVASPTPSLFAVGAPSDSQDTETILKERSSLDHLSPVMAKWDCDWMTEVLMSDGETCILEPGASVTVPMWFKGPETVGDHDMDILFYYESDPPHPKQKYRLLQLSNVLITHPSVSAQCQAMRSFCPEDKCANSHPAATPSGLLLATDVANISEELSEVSLVQISCISKDWCFLPSEEICHKGLSVIHTDETLLLTLKAIGIDPKSTMPSQEIKVFSHIPMGRVEVDNSSTPCVNFSQNSRLDLGSILCNESDPSVKECDKLRIEKDIVLLLVIIWKAKVHGQGSERVIIGLHHIPIQNLEYSKLNSKVSSTEPTEDTITETEEIDSNNQNNSVPLELFITKMVKCSLTHQFQVQHDFSSKRTAIVPVEITVRSTCDFELGVVIESSSHSESMVPENHSSHMYQRFTYIGGSKRKFSVKPHSSIQLALHAMFCGPGTYNLGNLNILVNAGKETPAVYPLPPHLIIINSNSTT